MSIEDTFTGAMSGMTFLTAYQNTVADEMGMDKAVSLNTKMCETMGTLQGQMLKEQAGSEEIGPKEAFSIMQPIFNNLGIKTEIIEESPDKLVARAGRCPVFEASQLMGRDLETIKNNCTCGSLRFMESVTKQLNPNLSYQLQKFRTSADDGCEEVIVKT